MTDVDETIPLATLTITPQVPGVTAGTGSVNSVPTAAISITPQVPAFQKYPLFEVLDSNGNRIDTVTFENLEAGVESDVQTIILVNNSTSSVDVTLTANLGDNGTLTETATSTYLSEDDADYIITSDTYTIPADSSLPVYLKWRPPSTSRPGLKTWTIGTSGDSRTPLSGWSYVGSIQIDGCYDGSLTDYQVEVVVDYLEDVMRTDFGDVRFTLTDETPLTYHLKTYTTSDTATFIVKVPSIPAKPDDTTILIHTGKSDAPTTSDPANTYLFFDDATGTYSDNWNDVTGTGSYTTVEGVQAISLNNASTVIRTKTFQATAPFKIEAQLYSTAIVTAIQYCQDSTPVVNERYSARIDVRSGYGDKILKGSSTISNDVDQFGTASQWADCTLTLDAVGNHTWTVDNYVTPAVATDTTYTTGYLALTHDSSGTGAVAGLSVSKYTQHPPLVNEIVWEGDYTLKLNGGVVYSIPDLPELDLSNHYLVNVGGVNYE